LGKASKNYQWFLGCDFTLFLFNFEPNMKMKIYQDGMVADGEVGMKIVEQGIKSGSKIMN